MCDKDLIDGLNGIVDGDGGSAIIEGARDVSGHPIDRGMPIWKPII